MNMAVDEAILVARISGRAPNTLRFYRWNPSAVSIGRFQDVFSVVNVESCRQHGVDIVRRITGGGAVYHDHDGEITYSVVVDKKSLGFSDVIRTYNMICNGLIEAAKILGVRADFHPGDPKQCPNVLVNGRKISGSAQHHRGGVLLQHGTFLVNVNLERMFTFLKFPWPCSFAEALNVARRKLTSIKHEIMANVSIEEAYQALVEGFKKALKIQLTEGKLSDYELNVAQRLRTKKFSTDSWNMKGKVAEI